MGYTTDFYGQVDISPPLNQVESAYLRRFAQTRRMDRDRGPFLPATYFCIAPNSIFGLLKPF